MSTLAELYRHSLALLTDLYQLTMAYGYWKSGMAEREAVFHLFFRQSPFGGQYAVACGLSYVCELLDQLQFTDGDLEYLAGLRGADMEPLFDEAFLQELHQMRWCCDLDAVPEGTVVFPHEPLIRLRGPILQCQIMETALLNLVNFQTLVATKAARICTAARGDAVLEFGLRRAQGIDGGITASRAAYVGGCAATSSVLAGKLFGIPVKGTHAHSWVMAFDEEIKAFEAYAAALPNNCIFLVDTYDTLEGVYRAVRVGRSLKQAGHQMLGVRLDSGNLAQLSIKVRRILDDAGFPDAVIVASNDLDEFEIEELKQRGARINTWGVGTRLVTAFDQPALGGVFKLSALRDADGWRHKIKLSEQPIKVSLPGILQVRRFSQGGRFVADMIYDQLTAAGNETSMVDPHSGELYQPPADATAEDLLLPIIRQGRAIQRVETVHQARSRASHQLACLPEQTTRLSRPSAHRVGLEQGLYELKRKLIQAAAAAAAAAAAGEET